MRQPVSWDDAGLLEDEPFRTHFMVVATASLNRAVSESDYLMRAFESDADVTQAACRWIELAFNRSAEDDPKGRIILTHEMRRVFVTFYWKLYKKDEPDMFLFRERKKRGYAQSMTSGYVGSTTALKIGLQARKCSLPPRRPSIVNKKQVLHGSTRMEITRTTKKSTNHLKGSHKQKLHRGGFEGSATPLRKQGKPFPVMRSAVPFQSPFTSRICGKDEDDISEPLYNPIQPTHIANLPSHCINHSLNINEQVLEPMDEPLQQNLQSRLLIQMKEAIAAPNICDFGLRDVISFESSPMDHPSGVSHPTPSHKPPLHCFPPIWAQSRQEVCESFDWFRSYQGGVYHTHNIVKGYLLSAFSSCRDRFEHDGRLIISHGGGKAESIHSRHGHLVTEPADDQLAQDKSIRALLKNYKESRPLVLLIDDKYILFPYDLGVKGVTYAVLGFYNITHVWAEYHSANNERGRVIRYKFAFQWCEGQGEPWWINQHKEDMDVLPMSQQSSPNSSLDTSSLRHVPVKKSEYDLANTMPSNPSGIYFVCSCCNTKTPQVYQEGWACLSATCPRFWFTRSGCSLPLQLNYNLDFLQLTHPFSLPFDIRDIRPSQPISAPDSITTTYAFTRGWHCQGCGRLSCRYKWEHWECLNCGATSGTAGRIRTAKEFWTQRIPVTFVNHFIDKSSGITQQPSRLFSYGCGRGQTQSFILPNGRGRIHHIQSVTPMGNSDADKIFREYQEQALTGQLAFRRWPMRSHKCRGPLLTNYFSQNSGEPYHYVGGTANTVPFSEAPGAVVKARGLIEKRIKEALGISPSFNEVLSAAYMERQKMAFHSDSELGLGPLVAGLSLGSPALMHFRLHHKYRCDDDIERKTIAMTFILRHGDILVMEGTGVQEYYEHTVIPTNFRIAATARSIGP